MYLQAIAGYKTDVETDHPDILRVRYNLGVFYHLADRPVEAEATMRQALEEMKNVFGLDREETLQAMQMLGIISRKLGKLAEAEAVFQ